MRTTTSNPNTGSFLSRWLRKIRGKTARLITPPPEIFKVGVSGAAVG